MLYQRFVKNRLNDAFEVDESRTNCEYKRRREIFFSFDDV